MAVASAGGIGPAINLFDAADRKQFAVPVAVV